MKYNLYVITSAINHDRLKIGITKSQHEKQVLNLHRQYILDASLSLCSLKMMVSMRRYSQYTRRIFSLLEVIQLYGYKMYLFLIYKK